MIEYKRKLGFFVGYISGIIGCNLCLRSMGNTQFEAYIDALFTLHDDSKMHTGMVVMTGKASVHFLLKKQQCMSKSQMDSELIGLTDNLGLVELFNEFVSFNCRYRS